MKLSRVIKNVGSIAERRPLTRRNCNSRFWHKAEIRRSGTFRESCGAINLQHVVRAVAMWW
ncbi:hypothetical protein J4727_19925 [Providencia rettgeri]|uniref:Uncharacterized protein n=1 Tax=Providencia rettgeri TaxID=587 RepID=A0A939NI73_PRORE|nr:hypothetical protein [Providencia rettgeri]